jgi:hypothetical protein
MITTNDVGEDDPAQSMTRSSRRCVNTKVEVEVCYDLAMMNLAMKQRRSA